MAGLPCPCRGDRCRPSTLRARGAHVTSQTSLLGVRAKPGRLGLALFRMPLLLTRRGWGALLGDTFLVLDHVGRTSGKVRQTVAMVLAHDFPTGEVVICSVWG